MKTKQLLMTASLVLLLAIAGNADSLNSGNGKFRHYRFKASYNTQAVAEASFCIRLKNGNSVPLYTDCNGWGVFIAADKPAAVCAATVGLSSGFVPVTSDSMVLELDTVIFDSVFAYTSNVDETVYCHHALPANEDFTVARFKYRGVPSFIYLSAYPIQGYPFSEPDPNSWRQDVEILPTRHVVLYVEISWEVQWWLTTTTGLPAWLFLRIAVRNGPS